MTEQADTQATSPTPGQASTWIGGAGLALAALGLFAAVAMWTEMSGGDFGSPEYTTIDKWLAVLTALIVSGLGLVALAVAAVLGRMPDRH